jgi:hypothetical protein
MGATDDGEVINSSMQETWIDNIIHDAENRPGAPFTDLAPVLKRLLALGATPRELSLISRFASYEAAFGVLYMLDDPGVDGDPLGLHESLLSADPSGKEGRPGSAPERSPM